MLSHPTATGGGLYAIRFPNTPYYYGGRAACFTTRWRRHLRALETHRHPNRHLQAVFDKHGTPTFEVLLTCASITEMVQLEQGWLSNHYGQQGCLNQSPFSQGGQGPCSEATKAKLTGKKASAETKALMSHQRKGRKPSPESVAKGAATRLGRPMSATAKENMSKAQKGRVVSETHKAKLHAAWERRKAANMESRAGFRKHYADFDEILSYIKAGGTLRGAARKFGLPSRKTLKKQLVMSGAWPIPQGDQTSQALCTTVNLP